MTLHRRMAACVLLATLSFVLGGVLATSFERSRALDLSVRELADSVDRNLLTLERLAAGDVESIRATARIGVDTGWVQIQRWEDSGSPISRELALFIDRLRARTAAVAATKDGG